MTNGEERTQGKRPGTMSRLLKKKKMHDNRAVIFFYKRIYSIYRRIIWQQPIMLMN